MLSFTADTFIFPLLFHAKLPWICPSMTFLHLVLEGYNSAEDTELYHFHSLFWFNRSKRHINVCIKKNQKIEGKWGIKVNMWHANPAESTNKNGQENTCRDCDTFLHRRQRSENRPFWLGTGVVTFCLSVSEGFAIMFLSFIRSLCLPLSPWTFLSLLSPERHWFSCVENEINLSLQENILYSWSPMKDPISCAQFSGLTGLFFSFQCNSENIRNWM